MTDSRTYRLLFVVCHPDDEAIWVGGLLNELPKIPNIEAYVICLSGRDPASPRAGEFAQARREAKYDGGVVLGLPLRAAADSLPYTGDTVQEGLAALGLPRERIDLLVTHSAYGDEQLHPHHKQAHRELKAWAGSNGIPFGYFSPLPIPFFHHTPVMTEVRMRGTLHLVQLSRCSPVHSAEERRASVTPAMFSGGTWPMFEDCPRYYVQFATDGAAKARMLAHYRSIGLESHAQNYAMFTNPCEAIYLVDEEGFRPFGSVIEQMKVPAAVELFRQSERLPAGRQTPEAVARATPTIASRILGRLRRHFLNRAV